MPLGNYLPLKQFFAQPLHALERELADSIDYPQRVQIRSARCLSPGKKAMGTKDTRVTKIVV